MRYKNLGRSFFCCVTIHTFDGRTDGFTIGKTAVWYNLKFLRQPQGPIEKHCSNDLHHGSPQPENGLHCETTNAGPGYCMMFIPQLLLVLNSAYSRTDGHAEFIWVAAYIPRWFTRLQTVTHPSTNRDRRSATTLIESKASYQHIYRNLRLVTQPVN